MTVTFWSRSRSRRAWARVMSADIEIWNAGASQAFVRRRAIVRRIDVSGTTSASSGAAPTVAWAGVAAARSTSSATIRPSGPVPVRLARSMLRSRAIRRASGEALTRPSTRERLRASAAASLLLGGRLPSSLALLLARGPGRAFLLLVLVDLDLGLGLGGDVLALLADDRDPLADLDLLALAGEDLQQDAARLGLDLLRHLVRVELVERLALLDLVALRLQPADDRARLHALPEPRKADVSCHCAPPCA